MSGLAGLYCMGLLGLAGREPGNDVVSPSLPGKEEPPMLDIPPARSQGKLLRQATDPAPRHGEGVNVKGAAPEVGGTVAAPSVPEGLDVGAAPGELRRVTRFSTATWSWRIEASQFCGLPEYEKLFARRPPR